MKKIGRFSSSKIHALIPLGKIKMTDEELKLHKAEFPSSRVTTRDGGFLVSGQTYIDEKNIERKLQRSLSSNAYSKPIFWGNLMEKLCFELLPVSYKLVSKTVLEHKEYGDFWCGTPDLSIANILVAEIKCYQLKAFAEYTDMLMKQDVELFKKEYPQEYWQIVSNSILANVTTGEAISYMPYREELEQIRYDIENTDLLEKWNFEPWQGRFIVEEDINNLPFIEKGGYYKNLTTFKFLIPEEDKELLTNRVIEASEQLIK